MSLGKAGQIVVVVVVGDVVATGLCHRPSDQSCSMLPYLMTSMYHCDHDGLAIRPDHHPMGIPRLMYFLQRILRRSVILHSASGMLSPQHFAWGSYVSDSYSPLRARLDV